MREVIAFSPADARSGGDPVPLIDRDIVRVFGIDEVQTILQAASRPGFGSGLTGNGEPGTGSAMEGPAGGGIGPDRCDALSIPGRDGTCGPAGQTGMPGGGDQGRRGERGAGQQ